LIFFSSNIDALGDWANQTVRDAGLTGSKVISCAGHVKVVDAFKLMHSRGVSCLGVVDADGFLAGVLSPSDLKHMSGDAIHSTLQLSVAEFLAFIRGQEGKRSGWIITVAPDATIGDVIRLLHEHRVHRLFVIDPSTHKGIGVISLTDILRLIMGS